MPCLLFNMGRWHVLPARPRSSNRLHFNVSSRVERRDSRNATRQAEKCAKDLMKVFEDRSRNGLMRMAEDRFQFQPVVSHWLQRKFGSPTEPQERGWPAIQSGAHTLIACLLYTSDAAD